MKLYTLDLNKHVIEVEINHEKVKNAIGIAPGTVLIDRQNQENVIPIGFFGDKLFYYSEAEELLFTDPEVKNAEDLKEHYEISEHVNSDQMLIDILPKPSPEQIAETKKLRKAVQNQCLWWSEGKMPPNIIIDEFKFQAEYLKTLGKRRATDWQGKAEMKEEIMENLNKIARLSK